MAYAELKDFIAQGIRMSHIYQPVMLKTLLARRGRCKTREIAAQILAHDERQLEYHDDIARNVPGRALSEHGVFAREGGEYLLQGFSELIREQRDELVRLCDAKRDEYVEKRGAMIWGHRKWFAGYLLGTLRYEVLKRAQFHYELFGGLATERALEVDPIVLRWHGGTDVEANLQVLCYISNSTKRDRADTDLRVARRSKASSVCSLCK